MAWWKRDREDGTSGRVAGPSPDVTSLIEELRRRGPIDEAEALRMEGPTPSQALVRSALELLSERPGWDGYSYYCDVLSRCGCHPEAGHSTRMVEAFERARQVLIRGPESRAEVEAILRADPRTRRKRWRVVLAAQAAPAVGDWVGVDVYRDAESEEAEVRFQFLDGGRATGFTRIEAQAPSRIERDAQHAAGAAPWLHFSDCMEVADVQAFVPDTPVLSDRTGLHPLWRLDVESLPSNLAFERRFFEAADARRQDATVIGRVRAWWEAA